MRIDIELTASQAATVLGVPLWIFRKAVEAGLIPHTRQGTWRRYRLIDMETIRDNGDVRARIDTALRLLEQGGAK